MSETHRRRHYTPDGFLEVEPETCSEMQESIQTDNEEEDVEEGEIERDGENGEVFLFRPKIATCARNAPGEAVASTRGDINQFRGIPNGSPKGNGERHAMAKLWGTWSLLETMPGIILPNMARCRQRA